MYSVAPTMSDSGSDSGTGGNRPFARLDMALVARGLAPTRARAQAAIAAGRVSVDGAVATRPSQRVAPSAAIAVMEDEGFVSRGAVKLAAALTAFGIDPEGAVAIDLGASTGGFTDVLLRRGARRVYAIDVGRGQLAPVIAADPRVVPIEKTHGRDVTAAHVGDAPDIVVCDVSFISLTKALGPSLALARPGARAAILVKPQFELSPREIGKGGLARLDADGRAALMARIAAWLGGEGWSVDGWIESPIAGGDGNVEMVVGATKR